MQCRCSSAVNYLVLPRAKERIGGVFTIVPDTRCADIYSRQTWRHRSEFQKNWPAGAHREAIKLPLFLLSFSNQSNRCFACSCRWRVSSTILRRTTNYWLKCCVSFRTNPHLNSSFCLWNLQASTRSCTSLSCHVLIRWLMKPHHPRHLFFWRNTPKASQPTIGQ